MLCCFPRPKSTSPVTVRNMSNYSRALVVLSSPLGQAASRFSKMMPQISKVQNHGVLYVHLLPQASKWPPTKITSISALSSAMTSIYSQSCTSHDIRILFNPLVEVKQPLHHLFFESNLDSGFKKQYMKHLKVNEVEVKTSNISVEDMAGAETTVDPEKDADKMYDFVCLGGTFDRIHKGHKILLTESAIRCDKKLTVGVTDESMIKSKKLNELIEPTVVRIRAVEEFLVDIRGRYKENHVVPISDPFGPAITDESLQCIVGSDETKRGCTKINEIRKEKGFPELDIRLIRLVEDSCREVKTLEETKVSSSNRRLRMLGQEIKPPLKAVEAGKPYLIGLTGGSASGKSNIAQYLNRLGAGIVDCDKLGHRAYEPGTKCYNDVIEAFGEDLKGEDGKIDRRKLGGKVFGNPDNLRKLESLVWPEILKMAQAEIDDFFTKQNKKVIVLDAAVLLQAGWDKDVHEVWGAFVDRDEAVKRIVERDGKTEDQALARLNSQMTNQDLISRCNSVFCSKWEYQITRSQVDKAWQRIQTKLLP